MKRVDWPDETGMGTLQSRGTGPARESMLPDTMMDRGTMGVDASTSVLGQNHRFGPGVVLGRDCDLLTPIPDAPPPPPPSLQDLTTDLLVTIVQLQSEVRTLKHTSPAPPTQATWTQLARHRPVAFTNAEVPKFR